MSNVVSRSDPLTSSEITLVENLSALPISGAGQAIQKTGSNTFQNFTPAGGGTAGGFSFSILLAPTIDGSNKTYTFIVSPTNATMISLRSPGGMTEGLVTFFEGIHYSRTGGTVTFTTAIDGAYTGYILTLIYIS